MEIIQCQKKEKSCCGGGSSVPETLTLPVAPRALSRIRFDPFEKQAHAVPPDEALNWVEEHLRRGSEIAAVDIAGPGDPLGEIDTTMETLRLIRQNHPDIVLSLTTLGIHAEKYANPLGETGVIRVTLLVDAVDREVANKLYDWIRPNRKTIPLGQATAMLMDEQARAVVAFKGAGCTVNVRTTVYPGFNDEHIEEIARVMSGRGAEKMILVPYTPSANLKKKMLSPPSAEMMQRLLQQAAEHIDTTLPEEKEKGVGTCYSSRLDACESIADRLPKATKMRPNVAVVSSNGMEVDLHLGQAYQVLVYGPSEDGPTCLLSARPVPEPGGGSSRWEQLAESLHDCFAILAASAGESPRRILGGRGITVLITENEIEGTVDVLYGGGKKGKKGRRPASPNQIF